MATGASRARSRRHTEVAPARECAFTVVRRVFEQGAFADRALHAEAAALGPRDRALAMALAYGTVQRRATLDYVASRLSSSPLGKLDPAVLAALRLGLHQLLLMDGIAEHAAVYESVELAKRHRLASGSLVNAVLRRAVREGPGLLAQLDDHDPRQAATLHSLPPWLVERWWRELSAERARGLLATVNLPAESALRVNSLRMSTEQVLERLDVPANQAPRLPEGLVLGAPFDAHRSELFADGAITPQSRASMLVARIVAPQPGDRVLDLCAAPGAKTTHLAALARDAAEIVAVERHPGRAEALRRTCERMGAASIRVQTGDAGESRDDGPYQRVLVDPPCSGLGTLQSRPDLRWRVSEASITELVALQRRILATAAAATGPGGTLVYSVCTISRAESEEQVEWFLARHPEFSPDDLQREYPEWSHPVVPLHLQLLPDRDRTDGFFIARLRRRR